MATLRDRFWVWAHEAGSHDRDYNLPKPSRMTPAEGAFYLGTPNLIMVRYHDRPSPPFEQYAVPFRPLRSVVWSIVGAGGRTEGEERAQVLKLAERSPNITGVMMDDFFRGLGKGKDIGALSLEQLGSVRGQLQVAGRRLDLWVVLYTHQLDWPVEAHLRLCDKVTLWTWKPEDLERLEAHFQRLESLTPSSGKLLGCYMYDFAAKRPMSVERMKLQCDRGLEWLRSGRIEGMIFLASCIADLDLEAVEWTRDWIARVGEERVAL
ncbi:MAG: hypothetical protein HYU36_00715 [Planctomycetes bacterium]|nr:hypothetical protein [Planctomycetota bacterium]